MISISINYIEIPLKRYRFFTIISCKIKKYYKYKNTSEFNFNDIHYDFVGWLSISNFEVVCEDFLDNSD